jgi:hypothetical protein
MKRRKNVQDQLIFTQQNIVIKYYLNFLIFFLTSSFRLKYYSSYSSYSNIFSLFYRALRFSFRSNYIFKNIILSNFIYFKLFKNYSTYNFSKFIFNKNFFTDASLQYYFNHKNKIQKYNYTKINLLERSFINTDNDSSIKVSDALLNYKNLILKYDNYLFIYNYFILKEFVSMIIFLIFLNNLNLYKLYSYMSLK